MRALIAACFSSLMLAPVAAAAAAPCELHLWPAARVDALAFGQSPFLADGAPLAWSSTQPSPFPGVLEPQAQLAALIEQSPTALLRLPTGTVVVAHEPMDHAPRRGEPRQANSPLACYAEIFVERLFVMRAGDRSLLMPLFVFRKFDGKLALQLDNSMVEALDPVPLGNDAAAELTRVFKINFARFAASASSLSEASH